MEVGASSAASNIIISPQIPYGVTSMGGTFINCKNLKRVESIPVTVKDLECCFMECSVLEGIIIIDATPEKYDRCFESIGINGNGIIVKGKSAILDEIIATGSSKITKGE